MAIRLTPLNSFQFTPQAGDPTYLNRGLQGDDIAYDPLTNTVFVAYTDDPDGATGTAFLPKRALLQFGSNNPSSPQAFGTYISSFDVSPDLLANAVGVTPITSGLGSGNFLVAAATTDATNTTEIVEYKADGTIATDGFTIATDGLLGATGKLTLPPQYYTNVGALASNGQPGAGRPVALALTGLGTLIVAMSQSQDLIEFSLTEKNADGTAKVLSTFDLTPFGLTRLAGLAIDPISGNFIVTDDFGGGTGLIYEFTPHRKELLTATITATVAGTPTSFPYPQEVNFPRLGNLVTIINPKQEFNLQDPEGVSFDSQNRQLYVVFDGDDFTDSTNNKVSVFSVATLDPNPPNPTDLNATPVPVLTDFSKFGQENGTIAFTATDFTSRFSDSKAAALTLQAIDIVTLPKHGSLKLAGVNVTRGQVIAASQLSNLVYTPNPAYSGTDTFLVQAAETLDAAGKPAITAPAITNVDLFVSDTTAIQVSSATNSYRFLSADDIVFNPTTGTIFAAESYRFNNTTAQSTVWVLKEINAATGAEIRAILQSPATAITNTAGASYTALPNVPIVDLLPGDLREGIQGIGVVAGTGTDRDGNILLLSTRGRRIVEIDPDAPVDANGVLQVPTDGINIIATTPPNPPNDPINFFNPNNPGIVNDGLHLPGGAFTVSPGALGSAVGVFHAVVGGQEFLYVADYSTRELVQYSKTGAKTGVVVDLQQITNGRIQGVTQDPVTGNFLLVDEETIAIYEVTPTGQLVGITDILSKATGDAAQQNKFRDVEGATIDPVTRTLYLGFDDDQPGPAGAFGDDTIGNLIAAFRLSGGVPNPTNPDVIRGTDLRNQIIAANTGTAAEVTINLAAGNYILSGTGEDDTADLGDLDIVAGKTIKIIGAGEDQTIIDGTALGDRIFHVLDTARLELTGVTLKNGGKQNTDINTIFTNPFNGGGVYVQGQNASLSVTDSTITNNLADNGAGIFIFGGEATVTGSTISDNESSFDAGGISALFGGRLTLTDSIVSDNTAARDAGGIGIAFGGSATITGGRIIGNDAVGTFTASGPGTYGIGGGVHHNDGTTTITGTIIAGNTASEFGGGVAAYTASTFNPIFNANVTPGTLTITDARISGNTADSNADGVGDGGGLYRLDTVAGGLTPVTVTIGNTALRAGSVVGNFDTPNSAGPGNIFDSIAGTIVSSGFNIVTNPAGSTGLRGFDQFPFDVSGFGNGINLSPISSFTFDGGDGVDFHNGQIYALQTNPNPNPFTFNSDVVTLNLDGTEVSRFNLSNTIDASGIDVRRDNGNLLIVSGLGGWVREYAPDGVQVTSEDAIDFDLPKLADGSLIVGLEFNPVTQTVYVADVGSQFDKAIIRQYDRLGNALSTLDLKVIEGIPDTIVPQGLTIDFNRGNFLVADEVNDSIYEITRFGSLLNTFNLVTLGGGDAKFGDPEGLAVDEETDTLYVIFDNDNPDQVGNLVASYQIDPFDPPIFAQDSYEFTIEDDAEEGDVVGEPLTATDPDEGDTVTYAITAGNDDLDEDTKAAFVIDTSTGQISIDDADDLTLVDVFNLTVTATDSEGLTATTDVEITVDSGTIEQDPTTPGIFVIDSNQLINLLVQATSEINNFTLGIFFTDDASGTIDGSNPGDSDYAAKALERSLSLLSVLGGGKNDKIPPGQLKKVLGLQSAASLVSAQQSTDLFFGFIGLGDSSLTGADLASISLSTDDDFEITPNEDASFSISLGNNTFTFESTYTLDNVSEYVPDLPLLVGDDDEQVSAVIADFSDVAPGTTVTVTASVSREAAYDNVLGFFAVNANGDVLTLTGGTVAFSDNDTYRQAVRDNLRKNDLKVNDGDTNKLFEVDITINNVSNGFYILPVLAVQGDFSTAAEIYYPVLSLNDDSLDRMASFGVSQTGALVFGFEDLPSAVSDRDFDDFVVQVTFG